MTLTIPGLAQAEPAPAPNSLSALVADVAEANQRLQDIGAAVQFEQESVNKAIVAVQDARDAATAAPQQFAAPAPAPAPAPVPAAPATMPPPAPPAAPFG
jgi:hypothetical protein